MRPSDCLEFEIPIVELEEKIRELRRVGSDSVLNISEEIALLEKKVRELTQSVFAKLSAWQISQMARHPLRPYFLDYLPLIFTAFDELHGDRCFADDNAIVGGTARLNGQPVMLIGQQKGHTTKEKLQRNFGMPHPEGYRKARRLMRLAERFQLPVITFIDSSGAYPGIGAEERGQSEAIARNLITLSELRVPVICTITGEGCSGGALAIGVGDHLMMLQYSTYSVISPEGCASILWKSADKVSEAAEAMGLTASRVFELNLCDQIIDEPLGGAHRGIAATAESLKQALCSRLTQLQNLPTETLLAQRYQKWMSYGLPIPA